MTILITGSSGALATDLLRYLNNIGTKEDLLLVDINEPENSVNYENLNCKFQKMDCSDYFSLEPLFRESEFSRVLHFASSMEEDRGGFASNIKSTINVVKLSERYSQPKIFFPQSFLTRDCSSKINDLSTNQVAESPYAVFKSASERFVKMYQGKYTIAIISSSVSPSLTIGPIPAFAKRISSGSTIKISDTSRDYISPESCSQAIEIASRPDVDLESVAIGSGISTHTKEIADTVSQILRVKIELPKPTPPTFGDPREVAFEPSVRLQKFGWNPKSHSLFDVQKVVDNFISSGKDDRQHHV